MWAKGFLLCSWGFLAKKEKKESRGGGGKQGAPAKTAKSDDGHAIRRDDLLCDQLLIAANDDLIDKKRAPLSDYGPVAGTLKLSPQALQTGFVPLPHFDSGQNDRHKPRHYARAAIRL